MVVYHSAAADFGADRLIKSGAALILEDCNTLTEELWRPSLAEDGGGTIGGRALVLQLDKDGGEAVVDPQLCVTASGMTVGSALALGVCNPALAAIDAGRRLQRGRQLGGAGPGWGNQTWLLPPTAAGGVIKLSADTSLCWGAAAAGPLQLVSCSTSPGKNGSHHPHHPSAAVPAGVFSGLSNATSTAGGGGVALRSGAGNDKCVAAQGTDTEEEDYGKITPLVILTQSSPHPHLILILI